jgi:SAM-dependent methyltransferase
MCRSATPEFGRLWQNAKRIHSSWLVRFMTVHESSFEKVRAFRNAYLNGSESVLEVGSKSGSLTLRQLFPPPFAFVGLDIEPGNNVDFVPADPYQWIELAAESFEVVVSNQTFEHIPYCWITMAEIARVTAQGGMVAIIAPSEGNPHRYPVDCWRFYPDSWAALCSYVGLDLIEKYRERPSWRKTIPGTYWRYAMMIARKPYLDDDASQRDYYRRIETIVSTRTRMPSRADGPRGIRAAVQLYEQTHEMPIKRVIWRPHNLGQLVTLRLRHLQQNRWVYALRRRIWTLDGRRAMARGEEAMPLRRRHIQRIPMFPTLLCLAVTTHPNNRRTGTGSGGE